MQDGTDSAEDPGTAATAAGGAAGLRAGEDSLATVQAIAKWCDDAHDRTLRTARWQLSYVWILVLLGMLALLFLPVVVEFIDTRLRGQTLPKAVVDNANAAVDKLELNYASLKDEADGLQANFDKLAEQIAALQDERAAKVAEVEAAMRQPFAVWERTEGDIQRSGDILRGPDGGYLLGGSSSSQPAIFASDDGLSWSELPVDVGPESVNAWITRIVPAADGTFYAVDWHADGIGSTIYRSADGEQWERLASLSLFGLLPDATVRGLLPLEDGSLMAAAGFREPGTGPGPTRAILPTITPAILAVPPQSRRPTLVWPGDVFLGGEMTAIHRDRQGRLIAVGWRTTNGFDEQAIMAVAPDEGAVSSSDAWTSPPPPFSGDRARLQFVGEHRDEIWVAGGFGTMREEVPALYRGDPLGQLRQVLPRDDEPLRMIIQDVVWLADGTLVAVGDPRGRDAGENLIWSTNGERWQSHRLFAFGDFDQPRRVLPLPDGRLLMAAGAGPPLVTVTGGRLEQAINAATLRDFGARAELPPGVNAEPRRVLPFSEEDGRASGDAASRPLPETGALLMPQQAHSATGRLEDILVEITDLVAQQDSQRPFLETARTLEQNQQDGIVQVATANEALEDALRDAEPVRQAISMGTRVAIIGLLIFLVQIVVNRYRYLQRLAGFYRARGDAFRLLAAQAAERAAGKDLPMLEGVTLAELTNALSPDAIGFDKAADPPSHHVSSLLQTALKR
ncbi:MAG: hypothetical protein AAFQ88_02780 [Pseudomonadota bacterium]